MVLRVIASLVHWYRGGLPIPRSDGCLGVDQLQVIMTLVGGCAASCGPTRFRQVLRVRRVRERHRGARLVSGSAVFVGRATSAH